MKIYLVDRRRYINVTFDEVMNILTSGLVQVNGREIIYKNTYCINNTK